MNTIINTSIVTDYSGEPPIVTYSNPVTTIVNQPPTTPVITRVFYQLSCYHCRCRCCPCCGCRHNCFCD